MTMTIDNLRERESSAKTASADAYAQLVRTLADGKPLPADAFEILTAVGKGSAELDAAAKILRTRRGLRALVDGVAQAEQERAELQREMTALEKTFQQAKADFEKGWTHANGRLAAITARCREAKMAEGKLVTSAGPELVERNRELLAEREVMIVAHDKARRALTDAKDLVGMTEDRIKRSEANNDGFTDAYRNDLRVCIDAVAKREAELADIDEQAKVAVEEWAGLREKMLEP